jgi:hypothetical protein
MLVVLAGAIPLGAQWPVREAPGVPRSPDGERDLTAPTPRLVNGRPDFSGHWHHGGPFGPPDGRGSDFSDGRYVSRAGSHRISASLPYTPYAAALQQAREGRDSRDNPRGLCRPMGIMQQHTTAAPVQYIHTPDLLLMLYEGNQEWRQIFTDGRSLPQPDVEPQTNGYSVGQWDGDALVVETAGFRDDGWLDMIGNPLTNEGRITERFRRPWYGRIEIEITIDDSKAYRRPFIVSVLRFPMLEQQLIEFVCRENNRFARRSAATEVRK